MHIRFFQTPLRAEAQYRNNNEAVARGQVLRRRLFFEEKFQRN